MFRIFLLLLICSSGLIGTAQEIELFYPPFKSDVVGLLGMAQDQQGYIWMVDNGNGLIKYGGGIELKYKPELGNTNSLISGRIENILIASDGMIWLSTFDSGLDRFDPKKEIFTHFLHDTRDSASIRSNAIRDAVEDGEGNIWVGTASGIDKYDKATDSFIHHHSNDPDAKTLAEEHVRDLYMDRSGILWIGTGSAFQSEETKGGLFSLNPMTGEVNYYGHSESENSLIDNRVRAIFEDSRGVFWVGTAGDGLHTMDRKSGTFQRHQFDLQSPKKLSRSPLANRFPFGDDHITFFEEDDEGCIWIGTFENGINRYDPKTGITDHYGRNETGHFKTDYDSFWRSLKTREGLLWFAPFNTRSGPMVANLSPTRLHTVVNDTTVVFCQAESGSLYLGTLNGVQEVGPGGELRYLFKTESPITDLELDNHGNLWATTWTTGLFCYDLSNESVTNLKQGTADSRSLSSNNLGSLAQLRNGDLVVGTENGIDLFSPERRIFQHFELRDTFVDDLQRNSVRSRRFYNGKTVLVDYKGTIWVGSFHGIFRFNRETGSFKKYDLGMGRQMVLCGYEDQNNNLWIGTGNHGLRRYDDQLDSFIAIVDITTNLRPHLGIFGISSDHDQNLWVNAAVGLVRLDPVNLTGSILSENLGFDPQEAAAEVYTNRQGEILVGHSSGYFQIDPVAIKSEETGSPQPFIDKLKLSNRTVEEEDGALYKTFVEHNSLALNYDQNDLSFELGYIDFINPIEDQEMVYMLENYDHDWRSTRNGDVAAYYRLPPGDYRFILKARDIYGNWNDKKVEIQISSPWYKTWWAYGFYGIFLIAMIYLVDRFQRARLIAAEREKTRVRELAQAKEIEKAYTDLKATQAQLIQSEKMASLGELTAGIAHEIQNPLNFVNNFSELNEELLEELNQELKAGNLQEAKDVVTNILQNEEKIKHHGKRAEGIVKSMLQHSSTNSGQKEITDINALCDEYLRLAYHGMRTKDKSFNVEIRSNFDADLPQINVVPQDLGRVFLNLINNAFHAVSERAKLREDGYQPLVSINTRNIKDTVLISITDNGPGISEEIKNKIFQPFFTTKPTGQGTGLGLSLSYDIVKAHGGEIKVETEKGKGTRFLITLPMHSK